MIIREVKISDIHELGRFATKAFYDAYGWYNTPQNMSDYVKKYFTPENLQNEIKDPETKYILAEENQQMIGYAKLGRMNTLPELSAFSHSEIERIYVDSTLQRKGVGWKLIEEMIRMAHERDNEYIWLGVWQKNEKAVNFYLKHGFEIFGNTQFILGDDIQDDYMMRLNLNRNV